MAAKAERQPERLPRGSHGLPEELVAKYQRLRLVDATAYVLAERGYARITTTEIAKRAGVSTATLYKHNADLWDCLLAAYRSAATYLHEELVGVCSDASGEWPKRLGAAVGWGLEFLDSEPAFAYLLSVEPPTEVTALRAERRDLIERLAALLRQGRQRGEKAAGKGQREERLVAAVFSLIAARVMAEDGAGLGEMQDELTQVLLMPSRNA